MRNNRIPARSLATVAVVLLLALAAGVCASTARAEEEINFPPWITRSIANNSGGYLDPYWFQDFLHVTGGSVHGGDGGGILPEMPRPGDDDDDDDNASGNGSNNSIVIVIDWGLGGL